MKSAPIDKLHSMREGQENDNISMDQIIEKKEQEGDEGEKLKFIDILTRNNNNDNVFQLVADHYHFDINIVWQNSQNAT